eukprot:3093228-Rhodomonas_salina.1
MSHKEEQTRTKRPHNPPSPSNNMIEIQDTLTQVSQTISSSFEAIVHIFDNSESENKANKTDASPNSVQIGTRRHPHMSGHASTGHASLNSSSCASSQVSRSSSSSSSSSRASAESDRSAFIAKDLDLKRKQWRELQEKRANAGGKEVRPGSMAEQFANMVDKARQDGAYEAQLERIRAQRNEAYITKETKKDFESKVFTVKKGYDTVCYLSQGQDRVNLCDTEAFWHLTENS